MEVVLTLIAVGVILWAVTQFIPMNATIKNIIIGVVIIAVVIYLLKQFGIMDNVHNIFK